MANATIVNLSMYVGEAKVFRDLIYQSDGVTPQNVTGWAYEFVVHAPGDKTAVYFSKTTGAGTIVPSNPAPTQAFNWAFDATVLAADTLGMFPDQYEYYFFRTDAPNQAEPTRGLFTLLQN